jgi:hypothetical protein
MARRPGRRSRAAPARGGRWLHRHRRAGRTDGLTGAVWQAALLRIAAWTARGLRLPPRNALLADLTESATYGRAYGFERAMDDLGAIAGPLPRAFLRAAAVVTKRFLRIRRGQAEGGWSGRRDLNPRPLGPQPSALPGYATPRTRGPVYPRRGPRPACPG